MLSGVSTSAVGPLAMTRPSRSITISLTDCRRQVQVVRRDDDRHAALAIETRDERRDLELIAEIERGRRFVEQQNLGRLRQRRGDDHALLLAAAERAESAILERRRARRAKRIARDREVVGPFELEQPEMRMPAHQDHLEHRVLEGQLRLLRHDRHALGDRRVASSGCSGVPSSSTCPAVGRRVPLSKRSSVVLPDPFGPRMPTMRASRHLEADMVEDLERGRLTPRPFEIPERDVIGAQQRGPLQTPSGRAPGSRAPLRSRDRTG